MGYFIDEIAKESKTPAKVSLSGNPNFIQFESKKIKPEPIFMKIINFGFVIEEGNKFINFSNFEITEERSGKVHSFEGRVSNYSLFSGGIGSVFLLDQSDIAKTTKNIKDCFTQNLFLNEKFNISISEESNNIIILEPKEDAVDCRFSIKKSNDSNYNFFEMTGGYNNERWEKRKKININLEIAGSTVYWSLFPNLTEFTIIENKTNQRHTFKATNNVDNVNKNTFYIGPLNLTKPWKKYQIAESMRNALLANEFLGDKFEITIPPVSDGENLAKGSIINIKAKGYGEEYSFSMSVKYIEEATDDDNKISRKNYFEKNYFTLPQPEDTISYSDDSISSGYITTELQIELYRDTGVFLGKDDKPNEKNMGTYINRLSKAYCGNPIWFNINILNNNMPTSKFLVAKETNEEYNWFDTDTIRDFRFTASRFTNSKEKHENSVFYYSNVFYTITGYDRTLAENNLSRYVYNTKDNNIIKPLTAQPELTHIKGQAQYFNFIFADPDRDNDLGKNEYKIGLKYKIYTSSNRFITEVTSQEQERTAFNMVNTVRLNIDQIIAGYKNAAFIEVSLYRSDKASTISEPIRFRILPDCLYKVNDFAFLNRLGGWSSFNFSGNEQTDFQSKATTYYQTHTPDKNINSEIESVFDKSIEERFTVQTMPVTREVCEWLKELSASKAVYELKTGRYIVIDELNIKPNEKDELFRLDMKYHYSDSYNAVIE